VPDQPLPDQPLPDQVLSLASFGIIGDLQERAKQGTLSKSDRAFDGSNPLVVLVESSLESLSNRFLFVKIVGFSQRSEAQLVQERRKLEAQGARPALQRLLFAFEPICEAVRGASYGAPDSATRAQFFQQYFPTWLDRVEAWSIEAGHLDLQTCVASAVTAYQDLADVLAASP
jgi:hypothetical protein